MIRTTEEVVLAQEGDRTARSGGHWSANPYLKRENMPGATGDSLQNWACKHDAWQRGFDGEQGQAKEALAPLMLAEMLERRLRSMPRIQQELAQGAILRIAIPFPQARDHLGRNWDVEGFECGTLAAAVDDEFRKIADALRAAYDLG